MPAACRALGEGWREKDDGDDGMEIDRGVVERQRQQLQVVLERQQRSGELDGGGGVDVAPECGVEGSSHCVV